MNKQLTKIVAASLLGDGYVEKQKYGNARYALKQKADHKDYVEYIAGYLSSLTRVSYYETLPTSYEIKGKLCSISPTLTVRTMAHPFYTKMQERYYLNRVKHISHHDLTLLDAEFLAIWYQEDGYYQIPKDCVVSNKSIALCTDSFAYGDLVLARRAIIERTGFIFNIQRRGKNKNGEQTYRLYLSRKQADKFLECVFPYIVPSFMYKIERQDITFV